MFGKYLSLLYLRTLIVEGMNSNSFFHLIKNMYRKLNNTVAFLKI